MATGFSHNGAKRGDKDFALGMYEELKQYLETGNTLGLLVAGKTGVGKSSLINSIIGCESLAEEGPAVVPVTPDLFMYTILKRTPIPSRENEDTLLTGKLLICKNLYSYLCK